MLAPNRTYLAPALLVDELVRAGVRHACVTPGSRSSPLTLGARHAPGPPVWTHLDERPRASSRSGSRRRPARRSRWPAPRARRRPIFLPAVIEAFQARVPLVVLTADRPPELRDCGAPQTIDQLRLFGSHVRWFFELPVPEATPDALRTARTLACRAVATACGLARRARAPRPAAARAAGTRASAERLPLAVERDAAAGGSPATRGSASTRRAGRRSSRGDRDRRRAGAVRAVPRSSPARSTIPIPSLPDAVATLALRLGAPVLAEPASNLRRPALDPVLVDAHDALLRVARSATRTGPTSSCGSARCRRRRPSARGSRRHPAPPQVVLDGGGGWTDPAGIVSAVVRGAPAARFARSRTR